MAKQEEEAQKKHADLLEIHGSLICTEDGQAFYNTPQGKHHAANYCITAKVKSFEVKAAKKAAKKTTIKKDK